MSNGFRFKQFTVEHNLCAMKVGTDGTLLGAWTSTKAGRVLDIGTGSGLIALMIAQRENQCAIDAIDINADAHKQALINIKKAPWSNRITAYQSSLQDFQPKDRYDLIISNPPFFDNAYKSDDNNKNTARHTDSLSFEELMKHINRLLLPDGLFSVVLPKSTGEYLIKLGEKHQLFANRICEVFPNPKKNSKRLLITFSREKVSIERESLTIEGNKRHEYTQEYCNLTKEFYLNF